jgi:hypothetical protein
VKGLFSSVAPLGAALSFLLPACQLDAPVPDEQSTYVDLYLHDGIEICEGQLDAYDRFVERIFPFYSGEPAAGFRVDVHVLAEPDCPGQSCVKDDAVWLGNDFAQYHEIVHIMQGRLDGRSMASLEEGTAEALGPALPLSYSVSNLDDLEPDFLFATSGADVDYPHGAVFTRFAIERWGVERFRELFRALREIDGAGEDDYRREFEATFGEALDDVWPLFVSEPRCAYGFPFCDQSQPIELPFELDGIDCTEPGTLGYDASVLDLSPIEVPYRPATILRLDNAEPRILTFELEYVSVYLGGCGDCSLQPPALVFSSSDDPDFPPVRLDLELQPGPMVLFVRSRPGGTPHMRITDAS